MTVMTPTETRSSITEEIGALMGRKRITARKLATDLDLSYSYFNRRMRGEFPFTSDDLFAIAAYFNVEITDLFGRPADGRDKGGINTAWSFDTPATAEPTLIGAGVP